MKAKATLSGRHAAVDRIVQLLASCFIVEELFVPERPPHPTAPVCRAITLEVPTNSHSPNPALGLVDKPAPCHPPEVT